MTFEPLTKDMLEHYGSVKCAECVVSALEGYTEEQADILYLWATKEMSDYTMIERLGLLKDKWFPFVHQMKTDSFDKAGEVFHKEWDDAGSQSSVEMNGQSSVVTHRENERGEGEGARMRILYSDFISMEKIGVRKDGTTYERFQVVFPEDIEEAISKLEHKQGLGFSEMISPSELRKLLGIRGKVRE